MLKTLFFSIVILFFTVNNTIYAQKGLKYDPEKGIVFDDALQSEKPLDNKLSNTYSSSEVAGAQNNEVQKSSSATDLHVGRKKDPPEVYYKSGLEYFKNEDYENAYKNFEYADSKTNLPIYKLWKAKALRKMGRVEDMLIMLDTLVRNFSSSDVADDALIEIAIYYRSDNDYEKALQAFTQVIEQYPFGVSSSTGEELPALAREQRKLIRAEMINLLSILNVKKEDLSAGYRQFQKVNGLAITGTGNKETVTLIKQMHAQVLEDEKRVIEKERQLLEYQTFTIIAVVGVGVTLFILLLLRLKISSRKKHIIELKKVLLELDLRKL